MTSAHRPFLETIEADLASPGPLQVYADWATENGYCELAHALRWMVARGKRPFLRRPYRVPPDNDWVWTWWDEDDHLVDQTGMTGHPISGNIPRAIIRMTPPFDDDVGRMATTLGDAIELLASALERLRKAYEVRP